VAVRGVSEHETVKSARTLTVAAVLKARLVR
jgi:hypothetical protein